MCNLYRNKNSASEVAAYFNLSQIAEGVNSPEEVYPGYPGLVIADGALRSMVWGFPLVLMGKKGKPLKPKPVNNAREDKLDSRMWRDSFEKRRCLIPLSAWAEAEGAAGKKTRTWLSQPDAALFAVAGIWRESDEWGACYSMVMTDSAGPAADVHNRMPVILSTDSHGIWTGSNIEAVKALCRPYSGELTIERTKDLWFRRRADTQPTA